MDIYIYKLFNLISLNFVKVRQYSIYIQYIKVFTLKSYEIICRNIVLYL